MGLNTVHVNFSYSTFINVFFSLLSRFYVFKVFFIFERFLHLRQRQPEFLHNRQSKAKRSCCWHDPGARNVMDRGRLLARTLHRVPSIDGTVSQWWMHNVKEDTINRH